MNTLNQIKILIGYSITEDEILDKDSKLELLEYIKKCSERELTDFLIESEIISYEDNLYLLELEVSTGMLVANIIAGAFAVYKNYIRKNVAACKEYKGEEKKKCKLHYKKQAINAELKELRASKSKCNKAKDPKKCRTKIDKRIKKVQSKLK